MPQSGNAHQRVPSVFRQENLAGGGLCLPRIINGGAPHKSQCFYGAGDVIEAYTMEEIPR